MKRIRTGILAAFIAVAAGIAISLLLPLGMAQTTPATRPAGTNAAAIARTSAVLEVVRPAGADDALWQRQIATDAAKIGLNNIVALVLASDEFKQNRSKMFVSLRDGEGLGEAVRARPVPGTALIEISVDCSDDPAVVATITQSLVDHFLDRMRGDERAGYEATLTQNRNTLQKMQDTYKTMETSLEDFIRAGKLDIPPAAAAPVQELQDYAQHERELKRRQNELAAYEAGVNECRRNSIKLSLESLSSMPATLLLVQRPQP